MPFKKNGFFFRIMAFFFLITSTKALKNIIQQRPQIQGRTSGALHVSHMLLPSGHRGTPQPKPPGGGHWQGDLPWVPLVMTGGWHFPEQPGLLRTCFLLVSTAFLAPLKPALHPLSGSHGQNWKPWVKGKCLPLQMTSPALYSRSIVAAAVW